RQSAGPNAKVVGRASTACLVAFENRPRGVHGRIRRQPKRDGRKKLPAQLRFFSLRALRPGDCPGGATIQATYSLVGLAETNIMGQSFQRTCSARQCLVNLGV